jgi:hypothetical protein
MDMSEEAQEAAEHIEVVFHVFSHGRDIWTENLAIALGYYKRWKKRSRCARLYIEVYTDRQNDVMIHEDCLLAVGEFPS